MGCRKTEFALLTHTTHSEADLFQLRLLLEELVCDVARFSHWVCGEEQSPVRIRQEVRLDADSFADVLVELPTSSHVIEVNCGYSEDRTRDSIARKYSRPRAVLENVSKLVLILDGTVDAAKVARDVQELIPQDWELELWDEARLASQVQTHLGVSLSSLSPQNLPALRSAIDLAKGCHAFAEAYTGEALDDFLLWTLSHWQLQKLFDASGRDKAAILRPGTYQNVAVVFADLSGFSGYVRDTPLASTITECLSAFCAKARYQILNDGGFVYQFLGDAAIGMFGMLQSSSGDVDRALASAVSLPTSGDSVSNEWQRQIDRIQSVHGAHVGIAIGELQILPLRPFSNTHLGAIGDAINMAARLSSAAQQGQVVISNSAVWAQQTRRSWSELSRSSPRMLEQFRRGVMTNNQASR
jgi:adenylate cyclase